MLPPETSPAPQPVRAISVWRTLLLLAGASLLTVAVLFPSMLLGYGLPLSNEYGLSDLFDVNLPLRAWTAAQLRAGHFPVWYPGAYGGLPLFSLPEAAPAYPLSTLFYLLFPPVAATAWSLVAHLVLAGVGAGLVARRLGASLAGQILAVVVISGGLWLPEHFRQLNLVHAAAWVPWLWLALERWLRNPTPREGAILGLVGGLLALAGHAQVLHHAVVALGIWTLYRLFIIGREDRVGLQLVRRAGTLALAGVVALLIGAPALAPVAELAGTAVRGNNADFQLRFPPHPSFLATLFWPKLFGDPTLGPVGHGVVWWEEAQYAGLLPLVLAAGWLALGWRERSRRATWTGLVVLGLGGVVLAYAIALGPLAIVSKIIPAGGQFRFPHRYLWFGTLALAVGAGLGLTAMERWLAQRGGSALRGLTRLAPALVILITVVDLGLTVPSVCPVGDPTPQLARPATLALPALASAEKDAPQWSQRFAVYTRRRLSREAMSAAHAWSGSQEPYGAMRAGMVGQYPSLWGWGVIGGYLGVTPRWAALATADQHLAGLSSVLEDPDGNALPAEPMGRWLGWTGTLGARWVTSPIPLTHPLLRAAGMAPTPGGAAMYLYENRAWTGAGWIAHGGVVAPLERDLLHHLEFRQPAQNRLVALQAPIPEPIQALPPGGQSTLTVSGDPTTGHLHLSGSAGAAGLAIVNMDWHPRWRAIMSGRELRPYRVNLTQVGVPVPAGLVEFDLRFDDRLERGSLAACLAGLLLGFGTLLLARKPHRRNAAEPVASVAPLASHPEMA